MSAEHAHPRSPSEAPLDDLAMRVLAFESRSWQQSGTKAEGIRDEFGISAPRYYRILGELIDSPAALRHDPMLVKRLLRLREARAVERARRSLSNPRPLG
jgi:hypothetical protein